MNQSLSSLALQCGRRILLLLCLQGFFIAANSQSNYFGSWNIANAEYYLNSKWNLWGEVQTRSQKLFKDFYYHELKGGINCKPNKNYAVLIGFGQYGTYSNGGNFKSPVLSHEFRMWEQLTLVNNISRVKLEHRYRIEQRWINGAYRNRFRYRLNAIVPLNKKTVETGTFYTSIYDEIFLTDLAPHFQRNRLYGGLGYQFNTAFTLQLGWIRQYDYSIPGSSSKDYLQTALFFRIHHAKAGRTDTHPSPMDWYSLLHLYIKC